MRQAGFKQGMEGLPCLVGRPLTSIPAGHPGTGQAELGSSLALPSSNPPLSALPSLRGLQAAPQPEQGGCAGHCTPRGCCSRALCNVWCG